MAEKKTSEIYDEMRHMYMQWAFFYLEIATLHPKENRREWYDKVNTYKKLARLSRKRSIAYKAKGD